MADQPPAIGAAHIDIHGGGDAVTFHQRVRVLGIGQGFRDAEHRDAFLDQMHGDEPALPTHDIGDFDFQMVAAGKDRLPTLADRRMTRCPTAVGIDTDNLVFIRPDRHQGFNVGLGDALVEALFGLLRRGKVRNRGGGRWQTHEAMSGSEIE